MCLSLFFFFQAEDGIRDLYVTGVQTCALPILLRAVGGERPVVDLRVHLFHGEVRPLDDAHLDGRPALRATRRSEEHTSELQSRRDLVCRLLLEKKKKKKKKTHAKNTHQRSQLK